MKTGRTFPRRGHRVGGMALTGFAALSAACASGGGAPPRTGAETEALLAALTGVWVLDESSSKDPKLGSQSESTGTAIPVEDLEQARREAVARAEGEMQRTMAVLEPVFTVFQPWPTLILRVDKERLVFVPTPGRSLELPMSGEWIEWIEQTLGRHPIRSRVYWDDDKLALEHRPRSGGQVRAVLEIVDGRLQISQRMRVMGTTSLRPWVLVYDRDEGGSRGQRSLYVNYR